MARAFCGFFYDKICQVEDSHCVDCPMAEFFKKQSKPSRSYKCGIPKSDPCTYPHPGCEDCPNHSDLTRKCL